jgi:thiosulfate dehydrogenase [quinone] large subunit
MTPTAGRLLALARLATGFVFLWAFLDKAFGFGYATPSEQAWVNGGSPTEGFLSRVDVGPFADTFQSWAGAAWADWLFMLGLLGVGLALVLGVAVRLAAVSGAVMMLLMWAAEWPLEKVTGAGEPSMSTNPLIGPTTEAVGQAVAQRPDDADLGRHPPPPPERRRSPGPQRTGSGRWSS